MAISGAKGFCYRRKSKAGASYISCPGYNKVKAGNKSKVYEPKKAVPTKKSPMKTNTNAEKRKKMISRALSEHLMRRIPARAYKGVVGGNPTKDKVVKAERWTRYLDKNYRRVLMSKSGTYFVIDFNKDNKPKRIYKPVVAFLNNPWTGNMINIRSNTPLPTNLASVNKKVFRVYDPIKDKNKFSQLINFDQKWRGAPPPDRTHIFRMLKKYTNAARTGAYGEATENEHYSLGNFSKTSKWYIPIRPSDMKKYKNISTTKNLPPLSKGDRRWARREAYRYTNDGLEEPFTAVLNAWNRRDRTQGR